jgi:phosphotransferase system enzyme I (PtsI)
MPLPCTAFRFRVVAIGRAHILAPAALDVSHYLVDEDRLEAEVERLRRHAPRCGRADHASSVTCRATRAEEMGAFSMSTR